MIKHLIETIKQVQATEGRIFCIGNGGSYDNSKLLAYLLNNAGISNAQTPGSGNDKAMIAMRFGQDQIFSQILERENLSDKDMLITVSGSGNSPNILEAIKLAQSKGSKVFGLGGRDGGEMARMAGRKECLIAKTNIMEVIEDIHASAAFIAGQLISEPELNSQTLIRVHNKALETIALMASEKNLEGYAEIIYKIEKSMMTGGRIIFVGDTNIGVSHIRADLGRGATNQFPFKLRVPENIGSSNSFSATGNDDGPDFTWYHALQNIGLQPNDLVVILNSPLKEGDQAMSLCNDLATTAGCETLIIGCDLPEMSATVKLDLPLPQFEFATAIMADLLGRTLNEHLKHSLNMEIKPLALDKIPPAISSWYQEKIGRNKKLSRIDTLEFERKLKEVEILPEGKVITFCYGQIFITDDPVNYGLRRDY